ncbi:MAG: alkaline phosphatase [Bacteroidales bacterium]
MIQRKLFVLGLLTAGFAAFLSCQADTAVNNAGNTVPAPKNVILLIGDGMGFNHVLAANYYTHGEAEVQPYEQEDWLQLAMATYPAATRVNEEDTVFSDGYSPRQAWSNLDYLPTGYTGSAESATAISTGEKTYSTSIGIGISGDTLTHISQAAKALGKSIGVVSSVPLSHATPAGFAAHNGSRYNYMEIARYLLFHTRLDLVMAPGSPDYDNDGLPTEGDIRYIGSREIWDQFKSGEGQTAFVSNGDSLYVQDVDGDGLRDPWTLIEDREAFQQLAGGPAPKRVLGIPKAFSTLHYGRSGAEQPEPFQQPMNENVPSLEELTKASLNVLSQNDKGFFVMIEGGAIDWAGHDNHLGRMIEEQVDFNHSIGAVIEWVEKNSSWEETLVIVTADHETGYLTGPAYPDQVNPPVENRGKGMLPDAQWNSDGHTNMLVPFYAKGRGSELFELFAGEKDPVRGSFIQNSEIGQVLFLLWGKPEIDIHQLK